MRNVPLYQGPGPPWCLGSIFDSTQIVSRQDGAQLGPLLFDRVNDPHTICSTGSKLLMFNKPISLPSEGADNCDKIVQESYLPTSIVKEHLEDDLSITLAMIADSNHILGNRLEVLKYREEKTFLIFPCGKNVDTVGALGITQAYDRQWKPSKCDGLFKSVSLSHPILQLAPLDNCTWNNSGEIFFMARTFYHVHISSLNMRKDVFGPVSKADFRRMVSHVAANTHIQNEFAAILDTGDVHIYDIQAGRMQCGNLSVQKLLYNDVAGKHFCEDKGSTRSSLSGFPSLLQKKLSSLEEQWWRGEYAWHPKTFLIAGDRNVSLIDFRENETCRTVMTTIHSVGSSSSFCHAPNSRRERFLAFARADYDGMFYFATATQDHVCLFDVRRPANPVLQWEHKMVDDFPGVLMMQPLSMLRHSMKGSAYHRASVSGRVILACAFRSGDIRAFCYGPRAPFCTNEGLHSKSSLSTSDLEETCCTWQLPSKIHAPKEDVTCWQELLVSLETICSSMDVKHSERMPVKLPFQFLECMSGIVLLPSMMNSSNSWGEGFNIFQLTGYGDILAGSYRASESTENGASIWAKFPCIAGYLCRNTDVSIQSLAGFCSYFHGGSCLKPILDNEKSGRADIMARSTLSTVQYHKTKDIDWLDRSINHINKPLSIYEIATTMLRADIDGSSIMEIERGSKKGHGLPYKLPTLNILNKDDMPSLELPLPFLLEVQQLSNSRQQIKSDEGTSIEKIGSSHESIADVCHLVESLTRLKHQQDGAVSDSNSNDPWGRDAAAVSNFFEHKIGMDNFSPVARLSLSSLSFPASKTPNKEVNDEDLNPQKNEYHNKFICSLASYDEDETKLGLKLPSIDLHKEIPEFTQVEVLNNLQIGWANWLQNFEPYQKYQNDISHQKKR